MPGGDSDWLGVLFVALGAGVLRAIDIFLPRGTRIRLPEKWFIQDKPEDDDEQ